MLEDLRIKQALHRNQRKLLENSVSICYGFQDHLVEGIFLIFKELLRQVPYDLSDYVRLRRNLNNKT